MWLMKIQIFSFGTRIKKHLQAGKYSKSSTYFVCMRELPLRRRLVVGFVSALQRVIYDT